LPNKKEKGRVEYMAAEKVEIDIKGKATMVDAVRINNKLLIVLGRLLKIARLRNEWYEDIEEPETIIQSLKSAKPKADILTFWQRIPEIEPKYKYYMEWEDQAVLTVTSYSHWLEKQTKKKARWALRKAQKAGVIVCCADISDEFIRQIMLIYNEAPVKRGKPSRHYGKDFDTVKMELSKDLDMSEFYGAYWQGNLIGFMKILYADRFADPVLFLSKNEYLEMGPNNILMAKLVEICEQRKIPYIHYGLWRNVTHSIFLSHNGFEKVMVPTYYVPLTLKGKIALRMNLQRGIRGILPNSLVEFLKYLRAKWYSVGSTKIATVKGKVSDDTV
jgi:hypothetical protein